ncbi:MAG TPA: HAMP domain-containing sensor histidine kinase [Chitinophagales bacterium]|nr:HAMP domain-containing sensor histidine kinase [Chitinophagales bacterium]
MDIYRRKSLWKVVLIIVALLIMGASLRYSNELAREIAEREEEETEMWAKAYKSILEADENTDLSFELEMIQENKNVPAILVNERDSILATRNIDTSRGLAYLRKKLEEMKSEYNPIEIELSPGIKNYIYYEESVYIQKLKFYPFVQAGIITAFLAFAYVLFSTAKAAEQNQLWVGMAKETAHQLGTPLTSLAAWIELLKEKMGNPETRHVLDDVQKDIDRLELVAERFSKIGSAPEMKEEALKPHLESCVDYIRRRSSEYVRLELQCDENIKAKFSPPLFEWVIENLLKNALDAMSGKGAIVIKVSQEAGKVFIDVKDTGKGIPKSEFKTIFHPGYSTKKRGWGLGLTLSKRIIEQYHHGKIFVKESSPQVGTVFRIVLLNST